MPKRSSLKQAEPKRNGQPGEPRNQQYNLLSGESLWLSGRELQFAHIVANSKRYPAEIYADIYPEHAEQTTKYLAHWAFELLNVVEPVVRDIIERQRQAIDISNNRLLAEIGAIALADPRSLFDQDGKLLPTHKIPEVTARAIKTIKVKREVDWSSGEPQPVEVVEYQFHDKLKALGMVAEINGLVESAVEKRLKNGTRTIKIEIT